MHRSRARTSSWRCCHHHCPLPSLRKGRLALQLQFSSAYLRPTLHQSSNPESWSPIDSEPSKNCNCSASARIRFVSESPGASKACLTPLALLGSIGYVTQGDPPYHHGKFFVWPENDSARSSLPPLQPLEDFN